MKKTTIGKHVSFFVCLSYSNVCFEGSGNGAYGNAKEG